MTDLPGARRIRVLLCREPRREYEVLLHPEGRHQVWTCFDRVPVTAAGTYQADNGAREISVTGPTGQRAIAAAYLEELQRLERERDAAREVLQGIAEYWNGAPESAVDAAEECRDRALNALAGVPAPPPQWQLIVEHRRNGLADLPLPAGPAR